METGVGTVIIEKKISITYTIAIVTILVLAMLFALWVTGLISPEDVAANFVFFLFQIVIITIFAIFGAAVIGMLFSQRIFASNQGFTPFEVAMMETHEEVKSMHGKVKDMEHRLGRLEERFSEEGEK